MNDGVKKKYQVKICNLRLYTLEKDSIILVLV